MKKKALSIAILMIAILVFFPFLLNSSTGKKVIFSRLSKNTRYVLEADKTYFSWFGPQKVTSLTAISPRGIQYKFPEISLPIPLWEFYKKTLSIGTTRIFHPTVIIPPINPPSNKDNTFLDPVTNTPEQLLLPKSCKVFGEVQVTDGKIILSEGTNSISIPKLQYRCDPHKIILQAEAKFSKSGSVSYVDVERGTTSQTFDVQAREIPTDVVDFFFPSSHEISLQDILGSTINMDVKAQLINQSGPLLIDFHAPRLSFSQCGTLYPEYYLLEKPLTITLQVTDTILKSIFPNSILQVEPIQNPITITIGSQKIHRPLSPSTEIKEGLIHIGKITCTNKHLLFDLAAKVLGIHDAKIDLLFCEMPVCYSAKILHISPFEIVLHNRYPLAMWGKIDYFQKKVNLTLALKEGTLRKVFGITSLPADYVITCPIKGSFDDIQLDIGKLVKRLSILLAKEKTKKQLWKEGTKFFEKPTINPPPIQSIPWGNK